MKVGQLRAALGVTDLNLVFPMAVALAGLALAASGTLLGLGMCIGAILALVNSAVLIKRVEYAVDSPSAAVATVSMQVGLLLTFAGIGLVTLLLLITSVSIAIAMGVTFFAVQTGEILLFYWARAGRSRITGRSHEKGAS